MRIIFQWGRRVLVLGISLVFLGVIVGIHEEKQDEELMIKFLEGVSADVYGNIAEFPEGFEVKKFTREYFMGKYYYSLDISYKNLRYQGEFTSLRNVNFMKREVQKEKRIYTIRDLNVQLFIAGMIISIVAALIFLMRYHCRRDLYFKKRL